jgi:hypothetical protein
MIDVSRNSSSFAAEVDCWVQNAIERGASDLASLVSVLPGVYPTEVLESVRRLARRRALPTAIEARITRSARTVVPIQQLGFGRSTLPVPHPLDFDWRFTPQTATEIVHVCESVGDQLICIGAPSVFSDAVSRRVFTNATLVDRNAAVVNHFADSSGRIIRCDVLADPLPAIRANVIVIDPPWYPEHFRSFLWAASEICEMGGNLIVSLPMLGTRPQIQEQLNAIYSWAKMLGFVLHRHDEGSLSYETPHFERNALLAAGIVLPVNSWRRGTLCIFRKEQTTCVQRPLWPHVVEANWDEATLYGTRLLFRKRTRIGFDDPSLIPIVPGDILPSVSRTHRVRSTVDVWTSGNRIFRCESPHLLKSIADALANRDDLSAISCRPSRLPPRLIDQTAQRLQDVARQELWERQSVGNR